MQFIAKSVSILFHPLLIVTYMLIILLLVNPFLFGIHHIGQKTGILQVIRVAISTFLIPALAMLMLRFLNEAQSTEMKVQESKFIPFVITGTFYLWLTINFINNPDIPKLFASFLLGATIALFLAFFINLFSGISLHTVGMGNLIAMVIITMLLVNYSTFAFSIIGDRMIEISMNTLLMIILLLAGLVGTCRYLTVEQDPLDIYGGFIIGIASQFLALRFLIL